MQNSRLWVCWLVIGKMALRWWFDDFGCSSQIILFSRMRSEGFVRLEWLVASSSGRRCVVVASLIPRLWGKLQNLSFSKVSKQVVMSFCVAGVAFCHIPTCLITCRKCQNWTKCSFCCAHVSRLESLVFLWHRRVYGGSCKTSPFRRFPSGLSSTK